MATRFIGQEGAVCRSHHLSGLFGRRTHRGRLGAGRLWGRRLVRRRAQLLLHFGRRPLLSTWWRTRWTVAWSWLPSRILGDGLARQHHLVIFSRLGWWTAGLALSVHGTSLVEASKVRCLALLARPTHDGKFGEVLAGAKRQLCRLLLGRVLGRGDAVSTAELCGVLRAGSTGLVLPRLAADDAGGVLSLSTLAFVHLVLRWVFVASSWLRVLRLSRWGRFLGALSLGVVGPGLSVLSRQRGP